jgi:hypothetical protein
MENYVEKKKEKNGSLPAALLMVGIVICVFACNTGFMAEFGKNAQGQMSYCKNFFAKAENKRDETVPHASPTSYEPVIDEPVKNIVEPIKPVTNNQASFVLEAIAEVEPTKTTLARHYPGWDWEQGRSK